MNKYPFFIHKKQYTKYKNQTKMKKIRIIVRFFLRYNVIINAF